MFIFPRPPNNCSLEASSITCPLIYYNKALVSLGMGVNGSSWRLMNNESKYEGVTFLCRHFFCCQMFGRSFYVLKHQTCPTSLLLQWRSTKVVGSMQISSGEVCYFPTTGIILHFFFTFIHMLQNFF